MARPTKFNPELAWEILFRIADGATLLQLSKPEHPRHGNFSEWCAENGHEVPSRSSVNRWLFSLDPDKYEGLQEFRDNYARAREHQSETWADDIDAVAEDSSHDWVMNDQGDLVLDREHVQRSKLRVETMKWLMARRNPRRFGDRVEVKSTNVNIPINPDSIKTPEDARKALAQALGEEAEQPDYFG